MEQQDKPLLGNIGNVGIDFRLDASDIVKLGLMLLIVFLLFSIMFHLIGYWFKNGNAAS